MRLLSFSDLHIDNCSREIQGDAVEIIASYIREVAPDRVIVAGDMAGGAERCIHYIEEIERKTGIPLSYVPGNHSIWTTSKVTDSWHEYNRLKEHHSSLIDHPIELSDEWVLIGEMGWYDYSFRVPEMTPEAVLKQRNRVWKDSVLAKWGMSDEQLCAKMQGRIESWLTRYQDKQIIFVNHFIPYRDYVPISQTHEIWNMIRPFMGTAKLGELLDRFANVRYVIFGHIHRRFGVIPREGKTIVCTPLGYVHEWRTQDLATEIRSSGTIIEI